MKKLLHFVLILGMFLGSLSFGVGLFCAKATKKENLSEAIQQINMVEIVKAEMGDRYELIGELLDTKEFKSILGTYTDGLIDYVADGSGKINITEQQMRDLFTNYSSILLQQYPELAFLPTDRFIDFLVENVNVESVLPSYAKVMEKMPTEALTVIKWMKAPGLVAGSLALFLVCTILYLVCDVKAALISAGGTVLISGVILFLVANAEEIIFSLPEMTRYLQAKPVIAYMLTLLIPIASMFIIFGALLMGISVIMNQRKGKSI